MLFSLRLWINFVFDALGHTCNTEGLQIPYRCGLDGGRCSAQFEA